MTLIRGLTNFKPQLRGAALAIGNFDGVHLGHQEIITACRAAALKNQRPAMAMIFEPQPQAFFSPQQAAPRLHNLREKYLTLRKYGIDHVLCIRFNQTFANCSAQAFISEVLADTLAISQLFVGEDFRFGAKRQGDCALLEREAKQHGFTMTAVPAFCINGERVSSTKVRQALADSNLSLVSSYLGRRYQLCGCVAHGAKRGRTIGVPTANILLKRNKLAMSGVYAVLVERADGSYHNGVANIGYRPTVDGLQPSLEVFLLDFEGDLYGESLGVTFLMKLRDEQKFANFSELTQHIHRDIQAAQQFFAAHATNVWR